MGWLRAILAQRRVDQYRKIGRETELDGDRASGSGFRGA